jgi:alpha-beta hydrolase superfamily lysophospholipase
VAKDILGDAYDQHLITLDPDDEGDVVATLVSRPADAPSGRAVLYVHGFVDYFFQTHLADFYTERGWHFYALDLRKYGRSLLPHQTPNFTRELSEYYPELDAAARHIRDVDGHHTLLVNGHSTGGLITSLWAHDRRGTGTVQGLFLNSPFFDFNAPWAVRNLVGPGFARWGAMRPYYTMPQRLRSVYGRTIHRQSDGEWDYDLAWKPLHGFPVRAGWVRAIRRAHARQHRGLSLDLPVLVACSTRSHVGPYSEAAHHADSVLNVDHIVRWSPRLGAKVTLARIEGGKHDLTLSPAPARQRLFATLDGWLSNAMVPAV